MTTTSNLHGLFRKAIIKTLLLSPALSWASDPNLQRSLNLVYGNSGGPQINYNSSQLLSYINEVQPPISAVVPFILNVGPKALNQYQPLLSSFNSSGIPIYPAIGDPSSQPINSSTYVTIAQGYRNWTDCIQLDGIQTYLSSTNGLAQLEWMINYLNKTLHFNHIQLNPWPIKSDHATAYSFNNPAVDSAMEQVMLDADQTSPYTVMPDASNWTPNTNKIAAILKANPSVQIIINYENKPEEASLDTLSPLQQVNVFNKTINNITALYGSNGQVHWTPPWSQNYDPIGNNTWHFIVRQLSAGNP